MSIHMLREGNTKSKRGDNMNKNYILSNGYFVKKGFTLIISNRYVFINSYVFPWEHTKTVKKNGYKATTDHQQHYTLG